MSQLMEDALSRDGVAVTRAAPTHFVTAVGTPAESLDRARPIAGPRESERHGVATLSTVVRKKALIFTTWRDDVESEISTNEAVTRFGGHDVAIRINPRCTIFPVALEPEALN